MDTGRKTVIQVIYAANLARARSLCLAPPDANTTQQSLARTTICGPNGSKPRGSFFLEPLRVRLPLSLDFNRKNLH